jgi:tetratricopeptide (TPR) repeat protein
MLLSLMTLRESRVQRRLGVATVCILAFVPRNAWAEDKPNCGVDVRNARCVRALDLHDEALRLYAEGRYRDALVRLESAVESDPNGGQLYFNLGKIYELLGQLAPALENYRRALELEQSAPEKERLQAMLKRLGGAQAAQARELEEERERERLRRLPPPAPPAPPLRTAHPLRPWIWAGAGAAVGLTALGGGLGAHALAVSPGTAVTTATGSSITDLEEARSGARAFALAADVCFGLAAASTLATITLGVLAAEPESPSGRPTSGTVSLAASPSRLSLSVRFE